MKKATRRLACFHWPRLCAESTGISRQAADNSVKAECRDRTGCFALTSLFTVPPPSSRGSCGPGGKADAFPSTRKVRPFRPTCRPPHGSRGSAQGPRLLSRRVALCAVFIPQEESVPVGKPSGDIEEFPAVHLLLAWWRVPREADPAGRSPGLVRRLAEMRARRCRRPAPLPRRFGLEELRGLTGLSPRRLKDALRRLEACAAVELVGVRGGIPGLARGHPPARPRRLRAVPRREFPTMTAWFRSPAAP